MQIINDLQEAKLTDPFEYLGIIEDQNRVLKLRVWRHDAKKIVLRDVSSGKEKILGQMQETKSQGIFEFNLDREKFTNQLFDLDITTFDDVTFSILDPYQFKDIASENIDNSYSHPDYMHKRMGAHLTSITKCNQQIKGARFAVFAPNAKAVSLIGSFNNWDGRTLPMHRTHNGCWVLFVPGLSSGDTYKYEIKDPLGNRLPHKSDPVGFSFEQYPSHASVIYDHNKYTWNDDFWLNKPLVDKRFEPISIYEVHLGSWRKKINPNGASENLTYKEIAKELIAYVKEMEFTHIELMPISEHPFNGSWGYQPVGLFAPTSRYGNPDDFKEFVDLCHQNNIGVIIDWVPAHFPSDCHGLARFDGTHLYEYADPKKGWHPDWNSCIYDFGRDHVRQFLVSNALYWFEMFHIDGIRVDAVASMLYLDYSRKDGQWVRNVDGGNHNYEAISLLKWLNEEIYKHYPKAITFAEESTAYPGVSRPTFTGGLGFLFKWNMGWMNDTLEYISKDPSYRKYHHNEVTFSMVYAYDENFILPLSHDEVVHGKGSILRKMPGDEWQQAANMRAYVAFMYAHPGKKLNFMGNEIAQSEEWNHNNSLDWHLLEFDKHKGMQKLYKDLNSLYKTMPALHELDTSYEGFKWLDHNDANNSVLSFVRRAKTTTDDVIVICNFTPIPRQNYRVGVAKPGEYKVLLNTDSQYYWGSNYNAGILLDSKAQAWHGQDQSIEFNVPPLACIFISINHKESHLN